MKLDIPLSHLRPGKLNPRQHFNEQPLSELAESIRKDGVLSNLIVRPTWCIGIVTPEELTKAKTDNAPFGCVDFEIVSGERRYRAALTLGDGAMLVPVVIRPMSDPEVLALNLAEQMQRAELTPIEEAEGFQALLAYRDPEGKPLHTAETLAERVCKDRSYIHDRIKLLGVPKSLRHAVEKGTVSSTVATIVARVPDEKLRAEFADKVQTGGRDGEPMTQTEAQLFANDHYMVQLKGAPFDTKSPLLLPGAGSCDTCPHRTGNMPEARRGRGARGDVCTNPACYRQKCDAAFQVLAAEAQAAGIRVLDDKEAARCFEVSRPTEVRLDSQWAELDTRPMEHLLKAEVRNPPTWRELVETAKAAGMTPDVVLAKDGGGRGRWLVTITPLIAAGAKYGEPIFRGQGDDRPAVAPKRGESPDDTFRRGQREHAEKRRQEVEAEGEARRLRELALAAQLRAIHKAFAASWQPAPIWETMLALFGLHLIPQQWLLQTLLLTKETDPAKLRALIRRQPRAQMQSLVPLLLCAEPFAKLSSGAESISQALSMYADLAGVDLTAVAKSAMVVKEKPAAKKPAKKSAAGKAVAAVKGSIKSKPKAKAAAGGAR